MTETRRGRVVVAYGTDSLVEDDAGGLLRCHHRRRVGRPVCGDVVLWTPSAEGEGVVESIEPRRTLIERADFRGRPRPVAANVDRMVVVCAVRPGIDTTIVDRYLVLAAHLGMEPLVLVNKSDLLDGPGREAVEAELAVYRRLDCPVLFASVATGDGLDTLRHHLADGTGILVGLSGVGKSSLMNAMVPDLELRIGALSRAGGQGRHTTTETTLFHLPGGGDLIDSPGIRTLRLGHLSPQAVVAGFPEIADHAGRCRFPDCRHGDEPGCAVREAVERGAIDPRRLRSLRALLERD